MGALHRELLDGITTHVGSLFDHRPVGKNSDSERQDIDRRESFMAESLEREEDPVLLALATLSEAAISSASDLMELNEDLAYLRRNRLEGWTWRRIIADADSPNPLASMASIAANLSRACGGFRRALALGLRNEGLQVTEIASMFAVSRQRVSALIRPNGIRPNGTRAEVDTFEGSASSSVE
jgi:hypothetical protein